MHYARQLLLYASLMVGSGCSLSRHIELDNNIEPCVRDLYAAMADKGHEENNEYRWQSSDGRFTFDVDAATDATYLRAAVKDTRKKYGVLICDEPLDGCIDRVVLWVWEPDFKSIHFRPPAFAARFVDKAYHDLARKIIRHSDKHKNRIGRFRFPVRTAFD